MTVLNKHKLPGGVIPPDAVYIGRGSIWGDPYSHLPGKTMAKFVVGSREIAVRKYESYLEDLLEQNPKMIELLKQLHGKDLVCFCAPLHCHGDILQRRAAELNQE